MSFGATLKHEREAKGIPLQEISAKTKIGVRLLKALEDEQFDQLPGGIFDKSFLRQYARFLALDEDQIISEYLRAVGATPEPVMPPPAVTVPEQKFVPFSNSDESPAHGYLRLIFTAVLLGAVIAGGFYSVRQFTARRAASRQAATAAHPASPPPIASPTPAPFPSGNSGDTPAGLAPAAGPGSELASGSQPPTPPATSAPLGQTAQSPAPSLLATAPQKPAPAAPLPQAANAGAGEAGALVLNVQARKECWVSISADGQKQWQGTLETDHSRRVQARDSFSLTVGDAGAVTLTLNGKPLPAVGRSGEVKTITISAKGLAQPEP